jgi:NHLM bacteriocin system ABC transporter ATP-binding protein
MPLPKALLPDGPRLSISNLEPLYLEEKEYFYTVEKGKVDLFLTSILDNGETGYRYHICSLEEGGFLFSFPVIEKNRILAVGGQNTVLRKFPKTTLVDLYKTASSRAAIDKSITQWINSITENLLQFHTPTHEKMILASKTGPACEAGKSIIARGTVLWLEMSEGIKSFNDRLVDYWGRGFLFPVTERNWVVLETEKSLTLKQSRDMAADGVLYETICAYGDKIAALLVEDRDRQRLDEDARINSKFKLNEVYFEDTLEKIGGIIKSGEKRSGAQVYEGQPSLLAAAAATARTLKLEIAPLPGKVYSEDDTGLEELARDNHLRMRQVLLKGDWWKEEGGSFVAFWEERNEDGEVQRRIPVALLREKGKSYSIVNPDSGLKEIIDGKNVYVIHPQVYMFYRSLPNRKLKIKDLLSFSSFGLSRDLLVYLALGILGSLLGLLVPEMTRLFFDRIIPEASRNEMFDISMLLFLSVIVIGIFELTKGISMARIETKSDFHLQAAVWDRLLKLPAPFFRDYTSGDLAERSMAVSSIRQELSGKAIASLIGFLFSLVYLIQIFRYSGRLAKLGLLLSLLTVAITACISFLKYTSEKKIVQLQGDISGLLLQFIRGVSKIKITAAENKAFGVWADKFTTKKRLAYKAGFIDNIHATISPVLPLIVTMIIYLNYITLMKKGDFNISTGTFLAFMSSFSAFQGALASMTLTIIDSLNIIPLYKRAQPILEAEPEMSEAKQSVTELSGAIEVSHINFRYNPDSPLVLQDVSLRAEPGEFIALVGGSGSGKSTLFRLLLGFEKAESGTIYYDDQDLSTLDVTSVRRQMGVVLQNGTVMQGSIFKNIVGSSNLSIEEAWTAAEMVGVDGDILDMPMGMHTMLPAGGGTLSGGQRQRLIIARAIVRRPKILFFDEATSALDNKTQAIVSQSLENLSVTRIVIAHRISTIMNADRIYVLQDGVMRETGTYEELMEKKGYFAELAARQQV